jgi:hypothetical protein
MGVSFKSKDIVVLRMAAASGAHHAVWGTEFRPGEKNLEAGDFTFCFLP